MVSREPNTGIEACRERKASLKIAVPIAVQNPQVEIILRQAAAGGSASVQVIRKVGEASKVIGAITSAYGASTGVISVAAEGGDRRRVLAVPRNCPRAG